MKKRIKSTLRCKNIIFFILLLCVFIIENTNLVFATESDSQEESQTSIMSQEEIYAQMQQEVQEWLGNANGKILEATTENNDGGGEKIYMAQMPAGEGNIYFRASTGQYVYKVKDENNITIAEIPFDVDVALSSSEMALNGMNAENYQQYLAQTTVDKILERDDGKYIKKLDLTTSPEGQKISLVVQLPDGTFLKSATKSVNVDDGGNFLWDTITNAGSIILDTILDLLTSVINDLLLKIADGIQALINYIMQTGDTLTIHDVIFGKIDKLSINFWGASSVSNTPSDTEGEDGGALTIDVAPAAVLKDIVSYWYGVLRGIALAVYLTMLLYIGVRILLASTGESSQKYKDMLTGWVVGVVILLLYPLVMRYAVSINESFVGMLDSNVVNIETQDSNNPDNAMIAIRERAEAESNLALTIVYIIMLGQLIILLGVYYKRVFMVAFLITIFPVVAALYIYERASKGAGKVLSTWTKEYIVVVFTQTFHAIVYIILIEGAYSAFLSTNGREWLMFVISVIFLFEGEKILRAIFGMQSSANTMRDLAATGAAVFATSKALKKVFKDDGDKTSQRDSNDLKESETEVREATKRTAVNNTLRRTIANTDAFMNETSSEGGTRSGNTGIDEVDNPMQNLDDAKSLMNQEALKAKTKRGIISKAVGVTTKAAGVTLGVTSGLASGSMKDAVANTVIFNEVSGMVEKGINGVGGVAKGAFAGQVMKAKVRSGAMDAKLKEVGFDMDAEFDPDPIISEKKAEIIREALAQQISGTRSGGTVNGELRFISAVDKAMKRNKDKK